MSSLVFRITGDPSAFKAAMGEVSGSLDGVGRKADDLSGKLGSLGAKMSIGLTAPILALGASVIKTATDMDSLKRGLTAVAGSSEEAERQIKRLQEVAKLPGLGFRDAVEGSIRLQAAGFSAGLAERSLKAFGNALATVGKGKAELDGVTLALSQIASKGKISAEEINQLAERVPQIRVAIKDAFGTADTEVLQKAGIKAEEFVTRVVAQLEKLKLVSGGPKNAFENLTDTIDRTATRIGDKLLPTVELILPRLEAAVTFAGDLADQFSTLSNQTRITALSLGTLAVAAGPVALAVSQVMKLGGEMAAMGITASTVAGVIGGLVLAYRSLGDALEIKEKLKETSYQFQQLTSAAGEARNDIQFVKDQVVLLSVQFPTLGKGIAFANIELGNLVKTATSPGWEVLKRGLEALNEAMRYVSGRSREMDDAIKSNIQRNIELGAQTVKLTADNHNFGGAAGDLTSKLSSLSEGARDVTSETTKLQKAMESVKLPTLELLILKERMRDALAAESREVDKAAEIMGRYGAVTLETAKQRAAAADLIFRTQRDLGIMTGVDQAPDMGGFGIDFKKLTKAPDAGLPSSVSFEEFKRMGKNVGELGMITKEQYEAMKQASKSSSKVQVEAVRQVSLVLTDLSRGITDVIFKGGKFGDMMKGVATEAAKSITRILIEGALMKLGKTLLGIGSTSASVFGGISSAIGGLFGSGAKAGGAIFSAAGSGAQAAGGISGMLGSAGSAAGSVGSAAGSIVGAGVSGVAGIVTGAVSAVSGIIGNFQMHGMNKTLDLIEKSTRYAEAYQLSILEKTNEFLPKLADIHQRLIEFRTLGIKLEAGGSLAMAGGGEVFYFDFSGANLNGQSQQSIEKMLEAAITRLKQKGLSK